MMRRRSTTLVSNISTVIEISHAPLQLHRHVRGAGQRVAVPVHGLQERRRRLPHPLPRRPTLHREAALLHGTGGRPVQLQVGFNFKRIIETSVISRRGKLWRYDIY